MPGGQILSLLALLFLLALSFQDVSAAVKTGDWITRENKDSFKEAFKWGPQPWSLEDNQKYCRNTAHYVTLDENIPNYTDTINQAVRLMNTKGGGTVFLGYGTFIVTAPIELLSGVCLFGKGSKNTTIKLQDKAPPFGSKSGLIRASGAEYIYLDKFAIDGNRANQDAGDEEENRKRAGIHFTLVNFVRMFDLKIVHNSGNAGKCRYLDRI